MKTKFYTRILLVVFLVSATGAMAQTKTEKETKEDELRKKEQISVKIDGKKLTNEELKKELEKVRVLQEKDLSRSLEDNKQLQDHQMRLQKNAMKNYQLQIKDLEEKGIGEIAVVPPVTRWIRNYYGDGGESFNIWSMKENSSLSVSKSLADVTFATDFNYEVKQGTYSIYFSVDGTLSTGELKIVLKRPNGKMFQEFTISSLADVNWNQSFQWEEEEEAEYLGKWIISIKADKAKGNYSVRVNSR